MSGRKFTELNAGTVGANSIFAQAQAPATPGDPYTSTKVSATDVGNFVNGTQAYADIGNVTPLAAIAALQQGGASTANANIADEYDSSHTYNTGNRVIYEGVLYVCNDDNVTGDWDSTKWDSATIDEIISALTAADIPYSAGVSVADKLYIEGSSTVGDTVWSYRKWNSGILEIWGKYSHAVSDSYHTWGSWYAYDVPSMGAYPISFIALHSTVVNFGSNVNIGMIGVKANANPLTNAPEGLLVRPTQGGVETRIYGDLYAKGTWK